MKSIIEKIKASVEAVIGDGRFYYGDADGLNVDLDDANYPCAFAQLIEAGVLQDTLGQYHERVAIGVYFANTADIDLKPLANETILAEMKAKALTWLASLRNNDEIQLTEVRGTDRVYITQDGYDVRLTAYVLNVTIEEVQGYGVCDIDNSGCGC